MRKQRPSPRLREYLMIKEAADFLGVTPETLRNWDRSNKLKAHRHPVNGYRLYLVKQLESLLASAKGEDSA